MESAELCIICSEPLTHRVILPCGHDTACMECIARMNKCYSTRTCPFCQEEFASDPIILANPNDKATYQEAAQRNYKNDISNHITFSNATVRHEFNSLDKLKCQTCNITFKTFKLFSQHIGTEHNLVACKKCYSSHRFLLSQLPLFPKNAIQQHLKHHPKCKLCSHMAFDDHELSEHMRENHFRCEICAKNDLIKWFGTAELLQLHSQQEHFICTQPECLRDGFIAFSSNFELHMHMMQYHNLEIPLEIDGSVENRGSNLPPREDAHLKRKEAKTRLGRSAKMLLTKKDVDKLFEIISNFNKVPNRKRNQVSSFIKTYHEIAGESANALFCDVMATICDPEKRAELIKFENGIGKTNIHVTQEIVGQEQDETEWPALPTTSPAVAKPKKVFAYPTNLDRKTKKTTRRYRK